MQFDNHGHYAISDSVIFLTCSITYVVLDTVCALILCVFIFAVFTDWKPSVKV
jgi:hypothetical protein